MAAHRHLKRLTEIFGTYDFDVSLLNTFSNERLTTKQCRSCFRSQTHCIITKANVERLGPARANMGPKLKLVSLLEPTERLRGNLGQP